MADALTCEERAAIDAHIATVGVTLVPRGVRGGVDTPAWQRPSAPDRRRLAARRRNICDAAAAMTVAQIAGRFQCSRETVYRTLRDASVFAVGMTDKRL